MKVVVIIVSFNTMQLLKNCLKSISKINKIYQIYVVDNGSTDGSVEMVKNNFPKVHLIDTGENLGFVKGNNLVLKKSNADLNILLNSDTEVLKDSLDNLVAFMKNSDYGIGSCKLYFKDEAFQPNAGDKPSMLSIFFWLSGLDDILPFKDKLPSIHRKYANYYKGERPVGWVSGSVMAIKKEVINKIGCLDENIFMYGEDVEYCMRAAKAGFKIGWTDNAEIVHIGGGSSKDPYFKQWIGEYRGLIYIYKKFYGQFQAMALKILIYFFTLVRVFAFLITGKFNVSQTYAKIIISL